MSHCKTIGAALHCLCAVLLAATCITTDTQASAPSPAAVLLVAAASDLQLAFADIGRRFEQETGERVTFAFGSSGNLAQQIEGGAPVDVFAAADQASLQQLLAQGRVVANSIQVYAQGRLVLAVNRKQNLPVHQLTDLLTTAVTHVVIANPEHAPYGRAARQALNGAGLWNVLAPKIVYAESVMQAMQYVRQGNAEAALIAGSVALDPAIRSEPVDPQMHAPLNQTMVVVAGTPHELLARQFMAYVLSQPGQLVLRSYGFGPPEESAAITYPRSESQTGATAARPVDLFPLFLSLKVATLATAICTGCGLALAWLLARRRFRGSSLLDAIATLPQVLPPSVLGYYLLTLLGANTGAGRFLESTLGLRIVFTWEGAVIASAITAFPLMLQSARAAFEQVDPGLEDVARTLGRPEWEVFRRVTVPLAGSGILAGVVLTFTRALGEFGATLMVAGNIPRQTQTLSLAIYDAVQAGDAGRAVLLVTIVTALTIALLLTARTLANRRQPCSN